ncbi:LuxR C-terminal-related transcriptional regulator [Dictyobacter kobayashii]|uniref:LuxR family transcriptional regulator n=1 Tax=Dictyobacter kobayashii TaxID=2014872 RepID=A0A402AL09_9CHLR|nr:LuxR C-terminal-related transcriptional regulator [Dictyobacter kobayashii]GCE19714.1 LuxR family transcriptional regulator [Dictyobacter kobayashii]
MNLRLSEESIQDVDSHIQGWWAGMQLTALALQEQATPKDLLQAFQGSQPALFKYLVQEVLNRQPQTVQTFLLRTSILPQLCDSLCNAILEQQESQLLLEELERSNLLLNPLDKQHQWYAYHPLFAEVLRTQLERNEPKELPILHMRASQWYAAHGMHRKAIQQALLAQEWSWAAQLVEQISSQHIWGQLKDALLLSWIEQLPREVVHGRPRLCLACAQSQFWIAPPGSTESWLRTAREAWKATHQQAEKTNTTQGIHEPEAPLSLLGEIAALQATIASFYYGDTGASQAFCQEALTHLQEQQWAAKIQVAFAQAQTNIAQGNFERSMQHMQTGLSRIRAEGDHQFEMMYLWEIVWEKTLAGQLHEAWQLSQQLTDTLHNDERHQSVHACWPYIYQANIFYEWNRLEEAQDLTEQAIQVGEQAELVTFLPYGYTMLLKLALSQERWEEASKIAQQMAYVGRMLSSPYHTTLWSCIDQMRFWLARGDLPQARRWMRDIQREAPLVSSLAREKQSIALARLLLAESQPQYALNVLSPLIERAAAMQRWYSMLEMLLIQVQAFHMLQRQPEALALLTQAVYLGAPEGYIRRFVDEGSIIAELLSQLSEQESFEEERSYVKTLLSAFNQRHETQPSPQESESSLSLLDPLSAREQEVLQLLARGASNQEIAEALVVSPGTIKHHVSNILSKLEVVNRTQAVARARKLGLLSAEE